MNRLTPTDDPGLTARRFALTPDGALSAGASAPLETVACVPDDGPDAESDADADPDGT